MRREWSTLKKLIWKRIALGASFIWKLVTGMAPLTISDAIAKPIKSLVQYGKCEQNGTPTPTSPVPIKCNNGELGMVDDELPSGYKRITGIKFDGDFWYDTGEKLTGDDDVTMTLANTSSSGQNVFGSYSGTSSGAKNFSLYLYGGGSTSGCYLRYGEQLLRPKFGSNERTISFGKSGTSGFSTDVSATPETFTTEASAYIGMLPNSSSPAYTGSIMGNILVGSRLKWIPCERVSDGVVGYYETVKGVFLEPIGTGTPVKDSYDTSHLVLGVIGTPEALTIGAQTASAVNLFGIGTAGDTQDFISGDIARNFGVLILDGTQSWTCTNMGDFWRAKLSTDFLPRSGDGQIFCTHFIGTKPATAGHAYYSSGSLYLCDTDRQLCKTSANLNAFLAAQLAAGTPVIVVYPKITPTTESVAPQPLSTAEGNNTVSITAGVSGIKIDCEYAATPGG